VQRLSLPHGRPLASLLVYGVLNSGLSYGLIYFAIREVTAGLTMVILAPRPSLTFLFAVLHRLEPFRWRALIGALPADEPITLELVLGALLVLAAVWVGALPGGRSRPAEAVAESR
jgi:drug/metabolite transporter (DMT)-like permease